MRTAKSAPLFQIFASVLLAIFAFLTNVRAATFTNYDSVVSLATNVTGNYTFTDTNGLSVTVQVTMTPYSASNASPVFTLLDTFGPGGAPVHLGIDSGLGGGDGNWVDSFEGVNFSASLVSASVGIITNSIQFSFVGLGIRPNGGLELDWTSSATTNAFFANQEQLWALDNSGVLSLASNTYNGELRSPYGNQYQLSDFNAVAGQSVVFSASFVEGNGSPVIVANPTDESFCADSPAFFLAAAYGDPMPTVQWQVKASGSDTFVDIPNATNTTLLFTPALSDSGSQYQAVFTNPIGSTNTTAATLTITTPLPPPTILLPSTNILAATTNTASTSASAASYLWSISNGRILGASNTPAVIFISGAFGNMTLTLTLENGSGCTTTSSTNLSGVSGGVYVSDDNSLIEKFDENGNGSPFGTVNGPLGIAFDPAGNLYVADSSDYSIEKFDTNGNATVFVSMTNSPTALAFDGAGNLYAACYYDGVIRRFDTNGVGSLIAYNLNSPDGLVFDQTGNLYVALYNLGIVLKYTPDGSSSIFATVPGASGMTFDAAGNLFVADHDDSQLWEVGTNGVSTIFASTNMASPNDVAIDGAGYFYVANNGNATVTKFAPDGSVSVFGAPDMSGAEFAAVWPLPPQLIPPPSASLVPATVLSANTSGSDLIYVNSGSGNVQVYGTNGIGSTFASGLGNEQGAAFDSAGNLYVVDQYNSLVEEYAPNSASTVFTSALMDPIGIAIDSANDVFVSDAQGIEEFMPAAVKTNFWSASGNFQALAFDGAGKLYLADYSANEILQFDGNGNSTVFVSNNISGPEGIAFDAAGNLYVNNNNFSAIEKFSPAGADLGAFAHTDYGSYGLAFDSQSNLYVTTYAGTIQKVAPDGIVSEFAYNGDGPSYLAIWPGLKPASTIAATPTVSALAFANSQFQFTVSGTANVTYIVQTTTNLAPPNWIPIFTNTAPFVFADTNAGLFTQQFYRVVSSP